MHEVLFMKCHSNMDIEQASELLLGRSRLHNQGGGAPTGRNIAPLRAHALSTKSWTFFKKKKQKTDVAREQVQSDSVTNSEIGRGIKALFGNP